MPALLLQQDWALGLIGLKFAHHMVAGVPEGRQGAGLMGRPLRETFTALVWPPLQAAAALLAAPYLVTRGLLPHAPLAPDVLHVSRTPFFLLAAAALPFPGQLKTVTAFKGSSSELSSHLSSR
jgi:hypothetical protein